MSIKLFELFQYCNEIKDELQEALTKPVLFDTDAYARQCKIQALEKLVEKIVSVVENTNSFERLSRLDASVECKPLGNTYIDFYPYLRLFVSILLPEVDRHSIAYISNYPLSIYPLIATICEVEYLFDETTRTLILHDDSKAVASLKGIVTLLSPDQSSIEPSIKNTHAQVYAEKCIEKYPFVASLFFVHFPELELNRLANIYLQDFHDLSKLEKQLTLFWDCDAVYLNKEAANRLCIEKIESTFADSEEKKKLAYQVLSKISHVRTLLFFYPTSNVPLNIETAKFKASSGSDFESCQIKDPATLYEILLYGIGHSEGRFPVELLVAIHNKYAHLYDAFPILRILGEHYLANGHLLIRPSILKFCDTQKWEGIEPLLDQIFSISDIDERQRATVWMQKEI